MEREYYVQDIRSVVIPFFVETIVSHVRTKKPIRKTIAIITPNPA